MPFDPLAIITFAAASALAVIVFVIAFLAFALVVTFVASFSFLLLTWPFRWADDRRSRRAITQTDRHVDQTEQALASLGIARLVRQEVRDALQSRNSAPSSNIPGALAVAVAAIVTGPFALDFWYNARRPGEILSKMNEELPERIPSSTTGFIDFIELGATLALSVAAFLLFLASVAALLLGPAIFSFMLMTRRYPLEFADKSPAGRVNRYDLVLKVVNAIHACGNAYGPLNEPLRREVSERLADVERAVWRAHRTRGVVRTRSHRHRTLKAHAGRVVGRLRMAEAKLDVEGEAALPQLADLLLTVAERYAEGKIGALLDNLESVEPAQDREPLRVLAFVALTVVGALGVSTLNLPEAAEVVALGGVGMVALVLVYWSTAMRRVNFLSIFGMGQ